MIKLKDLLTQIQEKNLSKDQLEAYRDQLAYMYGLMALEMADLEKAKAIFIDGYEADSDIQKKRKWAVTLKGLREIELKNYMKGITVVLSSLKNRIFNQY